MKNLTKPILAFSLSGLMTTAAILLNLPGSWGVVLQELGRGVAAMLFGGIAATLGLVAVEEIFLFADLPSTLLRLVLLTAPQIAVGLLWQRYRWPGGLLALMEHLAWNHWLNTPWWPIPIAGIIAIYIILIFGGKHDTYFIRRFAGCRPDRL